MFFNWNLRVLKSNLKSSNSQKKSHGRGDKSKVTYAINFKASFLICASLSPSEIATKLWTISGVALYFLPSAIFFLAISANSNNGYLICSSKYLLIDLKIIFVRFSDKCVIFSMSRSFFNSLRFSRRINIMAWTYTLNFLLFFLLYLSTLSMAKKRGFYLKEDLVVEVFMLFFLAFEPLCFSPILGSWMP